MVLVLAITWALTGPTISFAESGVPTATPIILPLNGDQIDLVVRVLLAHGDAAPNTLGYVSAQKGALLRLAQAGGLTRNDCTTINGALLSEAGNKQFDDATRVQMALLARKVQEVCS